MDLGTRVRLAEMDADVPLGALEELLTEHGYEPERAERGTIRLRNCPFHQLAHQHRDVVCGMNLALIDGVKQGLHADTLHPALDPQPGYCCVAIRSS
jgi:predicted ArsR family transcriptional regulator